MTDWSRLDAFLRTDPRDGGCGPAMELLHVYVELALTDRDEARERYPSIAAHLRRCAPCRQDFEGLLIAAGAG